MNSSFSKKRHIFEVNQKLEQRFLREQAAYEDPTQIGYRSDRGQLPKTQPAAQPAAQTTTNINPYGYDEKTGKGAQIGQETNPYGYDEKTGKGAQIGQETNPYGYDEKTGKGVQSGAQRTDTLKATHQLPGDRSYQYGKDFNGNWFALRLSDKKWIDLKNIPSAIDKLNKGAVPIGTQAAKQNKSTQTSADTTTPDKQTSGGGQQAQQQTQQQTQQKIYDYNMVNAFMSKAKMIADEIYNNINSDENKIITLIDTIRTPEEMDFFLKTYKQMSVNGSDLAKDLNKVIKPGSDMQEYTKLRNILSRLGYTTVAGKAQGNIPGGYTIEKVSATT